MVNLAALGHQLVVAWILRKRIPQPPHVPDVFFQRTPGRCKIGQRHFFGRPVVDIRVVAESEEGRTQAPDLQPQRVQFRKNRGVCGQQRVHISFPRLLAEPIVGHVVDFLEPHIHTCFHRTLPEQTGAERMDRANETTFHGGHSFFQPRPVGPLSRPRGPFQLNLESCSEFSRGFTGEGHRSESFRAALPSRQQSHHPGDHGRRLAGAGRGLHQHRRVQLGRDQVAIGLIRCLGRFSLSHRFATPATVSELGSGGSPT